MDLRAPSCLGQALLLSALGGLLSGCRAPAPVDLPVRTAMLERFCPEAGKVRTALVGFPAATTGATPAEWRDLRRPALAMMDAAAALPEAVADLPGYADKVASARTAGRSLVDAVDRRDAAGTQAAGASLLQACAGCHAAGGAAPALAPASTPPIAQAPATP